MKKPALLLVAIALPMVAALLFWLVLGQSERGARGAASSADIPPPEAAHEPSPAALSTPPGPALGEAPVGDSDADEAPEAATERRALDSDGSGRRIRGSVKLAPGASSDDSLRVVALAESVDLRQIYGKYGLLADLAAGKKKGKVLGSSPVAGDGSFELALGSPADAWLVLDGRFAYSPQPKRVASGETTVELAGELGGCLVGRVTLPSGVDDPAAALEALELELGPDTSSFSMGSLGTAPIFTRGGKLDPAARFELRALPAGFAHKLEVQSKAFAHAELGGLEFEPGRVREVQLTLLRGATLRGIVTDEQGAPLAEVEVVAAESGMWGFPGEEHGRAKSDADGNFEVQHVSAGKRLLLATKDGYLDSESQKLELVDEELRQGLRITLGRGSSISGHVRMPDGSPAVEATVEVKFDPEAMVGMGALNAARGGDGEAMSDATGAFVVSGLGKGPFVVKAVLERAAEDGSKDRWLGKAAGVKPDTQELELVLTPPSAVHGRVLAEDGTAVTKFALNASMESGAFFLPGENKKQSFEDPEGAFVLRGLEDGKWKIEARADGFGPMEPLALVLPRADDTALELVLAPAASVAGTVVDPGGRPVSDAHVTTHTDTAQRIQRMRGNESAPEATSEEDGTFLLTGLASGTSALVATREGFAASEVLSVEASASAPASGVVLRLRKGATVTGEVFRSDGKPAGGVQVVAQSQGNFDTNMQRADGTGQFRYEHLAPGSWTVTALLDSGELDVEGSSADASASMLENMRFTMIQLEDGEEKHVVLGAPPKDPVRIHGRVRHGDEPVTQGLVSFMAEGAKGLEAFKMSSLDADGRYQTELNGPGAYLVTVQVTAGGGPFQQNSVEFHETIPEAEEHTLDLALPLGSLRGTVRGADRAPLASTRVTLATAGGIESGTMLGGQYSEATTDESGRYTFDYLRPGTYAVAAGGALFGGAFGAKSPAGRLVRTGLQVEEGRALEGVDFQLEEPGDIKGRVVDAGGKPIGDVAIFVRDSAGQLLDRFSMITTKSDGGFTYNGVAAGEYVVSARGKGMASVESAPVRVAKGGTSEVVLTLIPGTKLVIEIVDGEGNAVKARVAVTDEHGREMQGMIGMTELAAGFGEAFDGKKQSIGPLAPGSYTVSAVTEDGEKASKPVTLDGQPERRLKLRVR